MTLSDIKKKTFALIEELSDSTNLTDDPDLASKMNYVVNQIQYELSRVKKIPDYSELEVTTENLVKFNDITSKYDVYQLDIVRGVDYELKAQGTIIKPLENGIAEIEYFRYPKRIDENTPDTFEFELSDDVLEIMPYGIAGDLLKSDVSNAYGNVYSQRYEQLKQQLDIRYNTGSIEIVGGIE